VFQYANEFNGDLSKWDISKVTSSVGGQSQLSGTFSNTYRFARKEQLDVAWEASNPTAYPGTGMYSSSLQSARCGYTMVDGDTTSWRSDNKPAVVTCSAQALPAKDSNTRCFDCFHDGKEW